MWWVALLAAVSTASGVKAQQQQRRGAAAERYAQQIRDNAQVRAFMNEARTARASVLQSQLASGADISSSMAQGQASSVRSQLQQGLEDVRNYRDNMQRAGRFYRRASRWNMIGQATGMGASLGASYGGTKTTNPSGGGSGLTPAQSVYGASS